MLITKVFLGILVFMIYIYAGLRVSEDIENNYYLMVYWIAYALLGFTILNVIMLGNFWGVLVNKKGPPGPRGPIGMDGDRGLPGKCAMDHNVAYTMKNVKEAVVNTILKKYPDTQPTDIVNMDTMKLKNNYFNDKIERIVGSKQYEVLLSVPETNDGNPDSEKRLTFGKSLDELTGYLVGVVTLWVEGILENGKSNHDDGRPVGLVFFTDQTAQTDISDGVANFFSNEVEKYDVWYWGSTRVFRPLQAEICRQGSIPGNNGQGIPNTRFPVPDRPVLEIKEITYSDRDTSKLTFLWNTEDMDEVSGSPSGLSNNSRGIFSNYKKPGIYIPKVIVEGRKKFYPVGCVMIEEDDNHKSFNNKKTILVSGDVVIPTEFSATWYDTRKPTFWEYFKIIGGVADARIALETRSDGKQGGRFYTPSYGNNNLEYVSLGDIFLSHRKFMDKGLSNDVWTHIFYDNKQISNSDILKYFDYNNNYYGPVLIPRKYLEYVSPSKTPVYANRSDYDYQADIIESSNTNATYNLLRTNRFRMKHSTTIKTDPEPFYKIKPEFTSTNYKIKIKEMDKQYDELGMGWFGHPSKQDRQYSIFAYLGLVPEGVITHKQSGRKYYIRHYGGLEVNRFVVFKWNPKSMDFTKSLKVADRSTVIESKLSATDTRYQWFIDTDTTNSSYIRLISYKYPNRYLKLNYEVPAYWNKHQKPNNKNDRSLQSRRPPGISMDHTQLLAELTGYKGGINNNNKTLFQFTPAYGTEQTLLHEKNAKGIDRTADRNTQLKQLKEMDGHKDFSYIYNNKPVIDTKKSYHPGKHLRYT